MLTVLLATYNSSLYLKEQLDSLLAQDCQDFEILIRDGGSTDDTLAIIRAYQSAHPERIIFLESRKADALTNFSALLAAASSELVMFCDHDDLWFPQKISLTLRKYREMEALCGAGTPMLVFTDSCVTDCDLKLIDGSMLHYQHLDAARLSLHDLILQNVPSGNTMLINRALIDLASPVPAEAVMHDHWLALTAAAFGKIGFVKEPTLFYRQHGSNVYGAFGYSLGGMLKKFADGRARIRTRFEANIRQAAAFGVRFREQLSARDREMLDALQNWPQHGWLMKRRLLLKYRILKSGMLRNLGMFLVI